jgi:hypothetical protein
MFPTCNDVVIIIEAVDYTMFTRNAPQTTGGNDSICHYKSSNRVLSVPGIKDLEWSM